MTYPRKPAKGVSATVEKIPSLGFTRGAIVRRNGGPNMLVVRGLEVTTACVVCEADAGGTLRLREYPTAELEQVLPHNQPNDATKREE